jgi:hypothetical protein
MDNVFEKMPNAFLKKYMSGEPGFTEDHVRNEDLEC